MVRTRNLLAGVILSFAASQAVAKYIDIQDPKARGGAIAALRERGPDGLDAALGFYDALVNEQDRLQHAVHRLTASAPAKTAVVQMKAGKSAVPHEELIEIRRQLSDVTSRLASWREAVDLIGGQRTCTVSRLYWYTDMAAAQAEAKRTGRAILSLRMLGKLTDEFSCANSRFFRTTLYSNREISQYLRDHFVLHWQSVRPVPRVTIDFGDGRKLERTLTGNSAHYVLTSTGRPLDALPGLYSPQAFSKWLDRMVKLHGEYVAASDTERADTLAAYHRDRRAAVYRQWARDMEQLGEHQATLVQARIDQAIRMASSKGEATPLAKAAARLAVAKTAAETPLLRFAHFSGPWIETAMDDGLWRAIADLRRGGVQLDPASVGVMRREFPNADVVGERAFTKSRQEDPILRLVRAFEDSITLDTVRNEYLLHRRVHEQFVDGGPVGDVDTLNEWVYAELFLTPSSDPWLGLAPPDVYTALQNDGRIGQVTPRYRHVP